MDIHSLLRSVLSERPSLVDVNELVRYAHHLALTRLKQLLNSGRLHLQSFPMTLESAAIDCIADIFERDSEGHFVELADFFSQDRDLHSMTQDQATVFFHTLIFTKVGDGLFRLYENSDPILSKIIRNTKEALQKIRGTHIVEQLGVSIIYFCPGSEARIERPRIRIDELERMLSNDVQGVGQIRDYLCALIAFLQKNDQYSRTVGLIDFAVAVKRSIGERYRQHTASRVVEDAVLDKEITSLVEVALDRCREDLHRRYVERGKLSVGEFERCFLAIREMVRDTFVMSDGSLVTNETYLREQFPDLTSEQYLNDYRTRFEYMAKLAKKMVRDSLKDLL